MFMYSVCVCMSTTSTFVPHFFALLRTSQYHCQSFHLHFLHTTNSQSEVLCWLVSMIDNVSLKPTANSLLENIRAFHTPFQNDHTTNIL